MVITMQRSEAEEEGGVIEWGQAEHTTPHTRTHTGTLDSAMATKLHCKYAQNDRSDREEDCAASAGAGAAAECGEWMQDGPSRLWAKQSHKVENYI